MAGITTTSLPLSKRHDGDGVSVTVTVTSPDHDAGPKPVPVTVTSCGVGSVDHVSGVSNDTVGPEYVNAALLARLYTATCASTATVTLCSCPMPGVVVQRRRVCGAARTHGQRIARPVAVATVTVMANSREPACEEKKTQQR